MVIDNYTRKAKVINVVDGDTFDADVDLGYYVTVRERFRVLGINAPEMHGDEKVAGATTKNAVIAEILGREVYVTSQKTDSFKRWLADVNYVTDDGEERNLSEYLLKEGLAVVFMK